MKEIANEDFIIEITPIDGSLALPTSQGNVNFTEILSTKTKASGKFILLNTLSWVIAANKCTITGGTHNGGLSATSLIATSTKCKDSNQFPLRKDDSGICSGTYVIGISPGVCSCTFKIKNAGQTKVLCN